MPGMAHETYELMQEVRKIMDEAGETVNGKLAMAILLLNDRLQAVEKWQEVEDTRDREASEYSS